MGLSRKQCEKLVSDEKIELVFKRFSVAKTKDMQSDIIPICEQNPEKIIIHTGAND